MISDDLEDLLEIFTDPKVMASFGGSPFSESQMRGWLGRNLSHQQEHGYSLFSVIHRSEGKLIGNCGLEHMDLHGKAVVELGYDFSSRYWGRGLATEAASAVRDFAFETLELERLVSLIRVHNVASQRVSQKLGMSSQGTMSENGIEYSIYSIDRSGQQPASGSPDT